jgi:hypothetical protein
VGKYITPPRINDVSLERKENHNESEGQDLETCSYEGIQNKLVNFEDQVQYKFLGWGTYQIISPRIEDYWCSSQGKWKKGRISIGD